MYEQYLEWFKKMDSRGKKLSAKKFGIKFGSYFPKFKEDGSVSKAKNGRVISIFAGNDTTNTNGHLYIFPSLSSTREIIFRKIGRVIDASYWEGSAIKWVMHPDSSVLPSDVQINANGDVVIPMAQEVSSGFYKHEYLC